MLSLCAYAHMYAHRSRPDPNTPIEETVRAMNHVIDQGWAFYWGTSECHGPLVMRLQAGFVVYPSRCFISFRPLPYTQVIGVGVCCICIRPLLLLVVSCCVWVKTSWGLRLPLKTCGQRCHHAPCCLQANGARNRSRRCVELATSLPPVQGMLVASKSMLVATRSL